jgi:hypothetical protein
MAIKMELKGFAIAVILTTFGCAGSVNSTDEGPTGSVRLAIYTDDLSSISSVHWEVDNSAGALVRAGNIDVSAATSTISAFIHGLPSGADYSMNLSSTLESGGEVVGECSQSARFDVAVDVTVLLSMTLNCSLYSTNGGVSAEVQANLCPVLGSLSAGPLRQSEGAAVTLKASATDDDEEDTVSYSWSASSGEVTNWDKAEASYLCADPGLITISLMVTDGVRARDDTSFCEIRRSFDVRCISSTPPICDDTSCDPHAVCDDSELYIICTCTDGWTGDGFICDDVDECAAGEDNCNQVCINTDGGFSCDCNNGYILNSDGTTCRDIDECSLNTFNCDQTCTNNMGGYSCSCGSGYTLDPNGHTCRDIDECALNTDNCDQTCTNTAGGYSCSCGSGYTLDPNGHTCRDIDECALNTDGCDQICTNTAGGYTCGCNAGYALEADGHTCLDINECATNAAGCEQTCTNTIGSFLCSCAAEYRLGSDGRTCVPRSGRLTFAKRAGGTSNDNGNGVAVLSLADGSIINVGSFIGTATFGVGESHQVSLSSSGGYDVYIAKFNADGTLAWARRAGGASVDSAYIVSGFQDGSFVVTGNFQGSATFGPGDANQTVLTASGLYDVFVAKYNSNGSLAWAERAGGTGNDYGYGVTALSDGAAVVTGYFSTTATFGSGESNQVVLTSAGDIDVFIAKYNSNGSPAFAKRAGGTGTDVGRGLAVLPSGTIAVTGYFGGSATFGPGESAQTILNSGGGTDVFVAEFDAAGRLIRAARAGGTGNDTGYNISYLPSNEFLISGAFQSTATFGGTSLISAGGYDAFIVGYTAGTFSFAKRMGGTGNDYGYGVAAFADSSFAVAGSFEGTAAFGSGESHQTSVTSLGGSDAYVALFGPGNSFIWVKREGGGGADTLNGMAGMPDGSTVFTGSFSGTATFGQGESTQTQLTSSGATDIYIAKVGP